MDCFAGLLWWAVSLLQLHLFVCAVCCKQSHSFFMFAGMLAAVATFVVATLLAQFWKEVSVTLKQAFASLRRSQVGTTCTLLYISIVHCMHATSIFSQYILASHHMCLPALSQAKRYRQPALRAFCIASFIKPHTVPCAKLRHACIWLNSTHHAMPHSYRLASRQLLNRQSLDRFPSMQQSQLWLETWLTRKPTWQ